ncbi:hypothetical protein [Aeromicrobium wangtongii]|uniref:Uncharacterized protein n=1 Tax=Aeromicrobium wangtongii TaxID=2969247 RepID=A0ABY5M301_9ACTN|nr:hypothetical protein [Aeromicrobium wangtongii]MCD9198549.1 hypothetical protein [Aeromicrobium wangtongii]UUP12575.1 hypothetical protein NQV15_11995 [Aeromicrobium wangtongii]
MKKTMSAAFLVAALALTSACGGSDDNRPTKAEVKTAITSEDSVFGTAIPEESADCVAGVLVDSDVSDKTLKAIVESDDDYKGSKDDEKALTGLSDEFAKCVTTKTPAPDATETPAQ